MNDITIKQLERIANLNEHTDPALFIVLATLIGACYEGEERKLADHVMTYTAGRLQELSKSRKE